MKYNYDLQYAHFDPATGVHTEVCVDTEANYGFFERIRIGLRHDEQLSEGGLWLGQDPYNGTELSDYDGVYELPKTVAFLLTRAGIYVGPDYTDY